MVFAWQICGTSRSNLSPLLSILAVNLLWTCKFPVQSSNLVTLELLADLCGGSTQNLIFNVCHSHWRTLCISSIVRLFSRHRRWFLARFSYTEKWWNSCDMSRCFTILVNICYQTIHCLACSLVVFRVSKMETAIHHRSMLKCLYTFTYLMRSAA